MRICAVCTTLHTETKNLTATSGQWWVECCVHGERMCTCVCVCPSMLTDNERLRVMSVLSNCFVFVRVSVKSVRGVERMGRKSQLLLFGLRGLLN